MAKTATTTLLTADDLRDVVGRIGLDELMDRLIARLHEACRDYDSRAHSVPPRAGFSYREPVTGLIEWMPAMQCGANATVKLVAYHPQNPTERDLPTILSSVLVFDTQTGHLLGLVEGNFLTAVRTGAASAIASRALARPASTTLGLIGCGAQAVTQLHALSRVFPLERVLVFDTDAEALRSFPQRVSGLALDGIEIDEASVETIVAQADILCTCTSVPVDEGPVFPDARTRPHLHVNAVGSDFPGKLELPASLLERSLVCPDFLAQAAVEGECQQLEPGTAGPELPELLRHADAYREWQDKPTVFDSTGWALEDHVAAGLLLESAAAHGCGRDIEFEWIGADPRDPYGFVNAGEQAVARIAAAKRA